MCRFYLQGDCHWGNECRKAHPPGKGGSEAKGKGKGKGDGRGKGKDNAKGKDKGKGKDQPKGNAKGGGKGKDTTTKRPCFAFADGNCTRNPCLMDHRKLTDDEKAMKAAWEAKQAAGKVAAPAAKACADFVAGNCKLGKECPFAHDEAAKKGKGKAKGKGKGKGEPSS